MSSGRGNGSVHSATAKETVHRGVRWRRTAAGRLSWFNEGLGRWVAWAPGADAPPVPPGWGGAHDGQSGQAGVGPGQVEREPAPARAQRGPAPTKPGGPPTDAMSRRPSMRSPYRLVPLVIALFIVAIALWQATRPPARATKADIAAAQSLKGQCLSRSGGTAKSPRYSPVPVSCTASEASVKVVAVLVPGSGRSVVCPAGSLVVQVLQANVVGEPSECVLTLPK
jgi:hypothetical protein